MRKAKRRRREKSMRFLLLLVLTQTPLRPSRAAIGRTGGCAKRCWWIQQALISKYWFDFLFFSCQLWRGEIIPSRWKEDCFYFRSVSILPSCSWPMRYGFLPALSFLVKSHQKILKTQEAGRRAINNLAMSKMSEIKIQTWLFLDTLQRSFPAPTCRMEKCIWNEFQIYSVSLEFHYKRVCQCAECHCAAICPRGVELHWRMTMSLVWGRKGTVWE